VFALLLLPPAEPVGDQYEGVFGDGKLPASLAERLDDSVQFQLFPQTTNHQDRTPTQRCFVADLLGQNEVLLAKRAQPLHQHIKTIPNLVEPTQVADDLLMLLALTITV